MATAASRLSSSRAKARLALWLVAAAVLAAAVVGYLAADRGNDDRDAVAAYVEDANTAQRGLQTRLGAIDAAYAKLRLDPAAAAAQTPRLVAAEREIAGARTRLAGIEPPEDARVLHRRLLRLLVLETRLAHDVAGLTRRLPELTAGRRELAAATAQLSTDLQGTQTPAGQSAAFERYSARLDAGVGRLSTSTVPVLLENTRRDDVRRLGRLSTVAGELGDAIAAQRRAQVAPLLRRLEQEVRAVAAAPAGRLFVAAYNRRVAAIDRQRADVAREFVRLDREL